MKKTIFLTFRSNVFCQRGCSAALSVGVYSVGNLPAVECCSKNQKLKKSSQFSSQESKRNNKLLLQPPNKIQPPLMIFPESPELLDPEYEDQDEQEEDQLRYQEVEIYDPDTITVNSETKTPTSRKALSYEEISKYFGLPFHTAAQKLGLHDTQLQRNCRRVSIKKWPYQKILDACHLRALTSVINADYRSPHTIPECLSSKTVVNEFLEWKLRNESRFVATSVFLPPLEEDNFIKTENPIDMHDIDISPAISSGDPFTDTFLHAISPK